jgi:hypothetical protein
MRALRKKKQLGHEKRSQTKLNIVRKQFPDTRLDVKSYEAKAMKALDTLLRHPNGRDMLKDVRVTDVHAALAMISTPTVMPPNAALNKRLDYLDGLVQLDNHMVSQQRRDEIATLRGDIQDGRVQGDPAVRVEALVNTVTDEAMADLLQRFNTVKPRVPADVWAFEVEQFPMLDEVKMGNFKFVQVLKDLERRYVR